ESIREAVTARTARIGFALAGLAVIGWFVTAKLALFANLEYLGDVFSALQSSTSFAKGRPLLYENGYGAQAALHNYYVLPLFYPSRRGSPRAGSSWAWRSRSRPRSCAS